MFVCINESDVAKSKRRRRTGVMEQNLDGAPGGNRTRDLCLFVHDTKASLYRLSHRGIPSDFI